MTGSQIKAARDLLGITQDELCESLGLPLITLRRIEGKAEYRRLVAGTTIDRVVAELERRGVRFVRPGEVSPGFGVVLAQPGQGDP